MVVVDVPVHLGAARLLLPLASLDLGRRHRLHVVPVVSIIGRTLAPPAASLRLTGGGGFPTGFGGGTAALLSYQSTGGGGTGERARQVLLPMGMGPGPDETGHCRGSPPHHLVSVPQPLGADLFGEWRIPPSLQGCLNAP